MTDVVRQGFICPFCMVDMGDFPRLQSHVEADHAEAGDGPSDIAEAVVHNFKGLFDKAKRGMRKLDAKMSVDITQMNVGVSSSVADLASYASSVQEKVQERARPPRPPPAIRPPPVRAEMGASRSHGSYFAQCRDSSVNESAVRTNMLIIRLDRLIHECPADPTRRKDFEREVVPWSNDGDSLVCPACAGRFGLTRRRHHCRLCGKVMCHNCSRFLSFLSARKLTNPAMAAAQLEAECEREKVGHPPASSPSHSRKLLEMTQKTTERMKLLLEGAVSKMAGDGSESLGSLLQQDASECLRVCGSCLSDLRRREDMMEQSQPPALAEQYETLDRLLQDITSLAPGYGRMADSINNGETMFTLKDAEEMRHRVLLKRKEIDDLSKHMADEAEKDGVLPKEMQLRKNVRFVAIHTLQGVMANLQSLPSASQYEQLVEKHKQEIAEQVERARQRNAAELVNRSPPLVSSRARSSSPAGRTRPPVALRKTVDEGWTPMQTKSYNPFMEEKDMLHPLFEQREIIKGYLSQAAASGRMDEVDMLAKSLRELEEEMRKMGLDAG